MIITTNALDFIPVKNTTIDNLMLNCSASFAKSLLKVYHDCFKTLSADKQKKFYDISKVLEEENKKDIPVFANDLLPKEICSLSNYDLFNYNSDVVRKIRFNSKDLKFEELSSRILWDTFISIRNSELKKRENVVLRSDDSSYFDIYPETNYHYFFGGGEFPFLLYRIARIGNMDYCFGEIVR